MISKFLISLQNEQKRKRNEWSKHSSRSENVHLNDGNAVIRYERLSHSYHIRVMDRIARRLRGDTTQTTSTLHADNRTCTPQENAHSFVSKITIEIVYFNAFVIVCCVPCYLSDETSIMTTMGNQGFKWHRNDIPDPINRQKSRDFRQDSIRRKFPFMIIA